MKVSSKVVTALVFLFIVWRAPAFAATGQVPVYDIVPGPILLASLENEGPYGISIQTPGQSDVLLSYTRTEYNAIVAGGYEGIHLQNFRRWEAHYFTPEEIRKASMDDLKKLWNLPLPMNPGGKRSTLPVAMLNEVIKSMRDHPVMGRVQARKYDPAYSTRFCFGQATYTHHVLLALGLHPDSIRKVFIVGPRMMPSSGLESGFHVATVAPADDGNWYTVDVGFPAPMRLNAWFQHFSKQSTDNKLRLYLTLPHRLAPGNPRYTEVDLGLTLKRDEDFYKGYFVDLFAWLREPRNLEDLGFELWPVDQIEWPSATAKYIYR